MDSLHRNISTWKELGFSDLQKLLDEQGLKISDNASAGSANRKDLSGKTKEFRKLEPEEKLEQLKPLLKLYQQEIDNLTNRAKFAESCFLSVYKQLADAPDPVPMLELTTSTADEVDRLKKRNKELESEVEKTKDYASLRKQVDNQDKLVKQKVSAKETELQAYWDERNKSWQTREAELLKNLDESRSQVAVLQSKLESGEANNEDFTSAQTTALERELERSQTRIAGFEVRVAELRSELEREKNNQKDTSELLHLENENSKLALRLEQLQEKLAQGQGSSAEEHQKLSSRVSTLESSLAAAQKKLAQQSDYDQLHKELEFLRKVEFGDETPGENSEALDILKSKNTKLQEDLKNLRLSNGKLHNENDGLQQSLKALQEQLKNSSQLVERLEGDLSTMSRDETFSTISGWTAVPRRVSPASSIRGGAAGSSKSSAAAAGTGVSSDVLSIITQQRDRFKEKCQELEEDLHRCKNSVTSLKKDCDALKDDNRELYKRARVKDDRFKGVYDEEMSSFHQLKSLEMDMGSAGNAFDSAFFALVRKAVLEKKFRWALSAWTVFVHLVCVSFVL